MVYSSIELIIVGKGPMRKYLQDLSRRLNLDVIFYDPLPYDKLIELMKSSWVFVLPSMKNGLKFVKGYDWDIIAKSMEEICEQAKKCNTH